MEAALAAGYALGLVGCAFIVEWLSAHTHRRSLRYRTAGFEYDETHDHWVCPEGQHLWPHEFDHERRLVRYRAKAHICNGCPRKEACTDSDRGREIARPLDPWPHSEAGRFHRGICLLLVLLAVFITLIAALRNHRPQEMGVLAGVLSVELLAARWLARDLRAHPAGFPEPSPASGLRMAAAGADGRRPRTRWASLNRGEERS
ncbi:MAG: transposase [Acidimicrobiales bacterium]